MHDFGFFVCSSLNLAYDPFIISLQATHVAAQYGQTAFLYHIVIRWNADPDIPDNDGRSSLHWYLINSPTCSANMNLCYLLFLELF